MSLSDVSQLGFYGKLPTLGDFVSRRLPRHFIDPWDQWLQSALLSSQEMLGSNWLSVFLVSPLWRFGLSPGVCGPSAWVGVMMPSVDKVGRYFPLILAQSVPVDTFPSAFSANCDWFEQLEKLALSVLNADFDFAGFDAAALNLQIKPVEWLSQTLPQAKYPQGSVGKIAHHYRLENLQQIDRVYPHLSHTLLSQLSGGYSVWAAQDNQRQQADFYCWPGMPPIDAYAGLLDAQLQNAAQLPMQTFQLSASGLAAEAMPAAIKPAELEPGISAGNWVSAGHTVVGNIRKLNEDAMLNQPQDGIWVVADGMGGHQSGDVASRMIVEGVAASEKSDAIDSQTALICATLTQINHELLELAAAREPGCVVGSTVVVLLAKQADCQVVWVGDSRLYRLRQGQLTQLTRDHSLVDELMLSQGIDRQSALLQAGANIITRAVGGDRTLEIERLAFSAERGDRYLLCSDGLDKELSEAEIAGLLPIGDCATVVENLINQALAKSGRDNITVIVAEFV